MWLRTSFNINKIGLWFYYLLIDIAQSQTSHISVAPPHRSKKKQDVI